ncbi:MAG: hypothetical protein H6828_16165, partial [Planctomycetes bacterium]|nr:hypothetical protein [Planctomycetota bacterium]
LAPLQLPGGATLVPSGFALGPSDGFDDCAVPGVTQGPPSDGACVPGADHYVVTIDVTMQTLPVTLGAADLAPWIGASGSVAFDSTAIFLLVGNVDPEIQRAQDVGASVSLRVVYRYCPPPPGSVYCTCESLAPCGNVASAAGCANSTGLGARLAGLGSASVSAADLALHARGLPPGQPALFCQGDAALEPGVVFGDGLRCLASDCVRLEFAWANALGEVATSAPLAAAGGASPGEVRRYQVWYRDPAGSPCGAGFNLSNGYEVVWAP